MPGRTREPQSYGSQADWTTGRTGQQPNDPKSEPPPEQREFYADERESENNEPYQGGRMSPVTMAENQRQPGSPRGDAAPTTSVTLREGGAKRNGFFRKRDYEQDA